MSNFEFRANGVVVHEADDGRHVLTREGVVKYDGGSIVVAPPPIVYPAIDYSLPKYNGDQFGGGMETRQMMQYIQTWVHPNGLPPNWNWSEWARVTGRQLPSSTNQGPGTDKSGTNLDLPGRRENDFVADVPQLFTFTIDGDRQVVLTFASLSGNYFNYITQQLTGTGRHGSTANRQFVFDSHFTRSDFLRAGSYTWAVSIDVSGRAGTQKV